MKNLLAFLVLASYGLAVEPVPRKLAGEDVEKLVKLADAWEVPQPKPASKLIKIVAYWSGNSSEKQTTYYKFGFIEPGDTKRALIGFQYHDLEREKTILDVENPDDFDLEFIACSSFSSSNYGIITGVQLVRAGQKKLGTALIEKSLTVDSGHRFALTYSRADQKPEVMLAQSCLASAMSDIASAKPDFKAIKRRIERIVADQPDEKWKYEATLESLQAAIDHPVSPPGSIERAIDEFLLSGIHAEGQRWGNNRDEREQRLIRLGFKAVPALLKQLDSNRATNHMRIGFNNFPSFNLVAGQVISDYLQRLANDEAEDGWLQRQQGGSLDAESFQRWWKKAAALGEEAYVQKFTVQLVPDVLEEKPPISDARISDELLLLATERYPKFLPELYRKLLPTKQSSWPVLEPIIKSKDFTAEEKYKLVMAGIATNHEAHRNDALEALYELRPQEADAVLTKLLRAAPAKVKTSGTFDSAETQDVYLASFVAQTKDPQVWQAYMALLERADTELKMELIYRLSAHGELSLELAKRLQPIYDLYRDDPAMREDCRSGFWAAMTYGRISMRNYIHYQWNEWLKLELSPPKYPGTDLEWENYRAVVDQAVRKKVAVETK